MKQSESHKSISWFKLAEFVERGEKERALGIYKLLALSINDIAFTYQLEGDILLAFEDQLANSKYLQAVEHYIKQNNIPAAIGTLNHLVILTPNHDLAWDMLGELYLKHCLNKITIHLRNLINYQKITQAQKCITNAIQVYQKEPNLSALNNFLNEIEKLDSNLHKHAMQILRK